MISILINISQTSEEVTEIQFHTVNGKTQTDSEQHYADLISTALEAVANSIEVIEETEVTR